MIYNGTAKRFAKETCTKNKISVYWVCMKDYFGTPGLRTDNLYVTQGLTRLTASLVYILFHLGQNCL